MREFIGNCVQNPFRDVEELTEIIDSAQEITEEQFILNCDVDDEVLEQIKRFPYDFEYYKNGNVYFFTHSMIEHFFK